jgi:hypothetical protein
MNAFEETTTASQHGIAGPAESKETAPEVGRARLAVSSTAKRVAEAEALLRKRKRKLREEQELMVLRTVAAERLGGGWAAKNRNAIFDALIAELALA